MERNEKSIVFLDTHVVVWCFYGKIQKIPVRAKEEINRSELRISPLVKLELQYLFEIQRIPEPPEKIISKLEFLIGLQVSQTPFASIVEASINLDFTRDVFDRLILAEAIFRKAPLITADSVLLKNSKKALWD